MDEMLEVRLAGGNDAPGLARTALCGLNGSLGELRSPVSLLVSELVTNAVRHGGAGPDRTVCVKLDASKDRVRGEVSDEGPGFDHRATRRTDPIEDGFGFTLVDQISDRWGVEIGAETRVWFEIDRESAT